MEPIESKSETATPRLPSPPPKPEAPELPSPITLTARERAAIQHYQDQYNEASKDLEEAKKALEIICSIIVERAGGDLKYRYTITPDLAAMVPEAKEKA